MSTPEQSPHTSHAHDEALPEEPKTPFWLTALGVALLVSGAVGYLFVHEPTVEEEAAEPEATEEKAKEPEKKEVVKPRPPARGLPKRLPAAGASGKRPRPRVPDLKNLLPKRH